jgi:hypothetical protein
MTLSSATVRFGQKGPVIDPGAPLPLAALLVGKSVAEAVETLPRLFNICRAAQGTAARLSVGLPAEADLMEEVIRDHVLKLCITMPHSFGLAPLPIPQDPAVLLGPAGLPAQGLEGWDSPLQPLVAAVRAAFPDRAAVAAALEAPPEPLAEGAFENSAAGRQSRHPLMQSIEATHGRGPLWRLAGLVVDLAAALAGHVQPATVADGIATVPAARGTYALRLAVTDGRVTGIDRRTPTDHLLASGGTLEQALSSLPSHLWHLAPQVIALHDPCIPVGFAESLHA